MKGIFSNRLRTILVLLAVVLLLGIGVIALRSNRLAGRSEKSAMTPVVTNVSSSSAVSNVPTTPSPRASLTTNSAGVWLRPLAVVKETGSHQWTVENGRDTNVIRQLAHNELEYQRMVEENARIKRRQLVYRKDTAAAVMQRARLNGQPVTQLTLPGLDGQEFRFTIEQSDLEPSEQVGSFRGHLAGKPNSMITLAYKFGREAFTILSPDDGVYLQGHPREPGELIITSFDPEIYQSMPGGEPIRTTQK